MKLLRNNHTSRRVLWFLVMVLDASPFATGQWSIYPEVNTPICTAPVLQLEPQIATDGAGGAIMTWIDSRNSAGNFNWDIYAQRIDSAGVAQWSTNGIAIAAGAHDQVTPVIMSDNTGGAIITWIDSPHGPPYAYDIYAQRVNAAGVVLWGTNGVPICTAGGDQMKPSLVSDGAGGAIISWRDQRYGYFGDIFAQRVSAAGVVQWGVNGVPICVSPTNQDYLRSTSDGMGGAIITWMDWQAEIQEWKIYAQHVNGAGAIQWEANGLPVAQSMYQSGPSVVSDGKGGAIIFWMDGRNDTLGLGSDIYAQRFNGSGTAQWIPDGVRVSLGSSQSTISDGAGGAMLAYIRNGRFYSQRIDSSGAPQWGVDGEVISTFYHYQSSPSIVSDHEGGAIIGWGDRDYGDSFAQRINADGTVRWTANGVVINITGTLGDFVGDGAGGAIFTWSEGRNAVNSDYGDIYAQNIRGDGLLYPRPYVTHIDDVPDDQGGMLQIGWRKSDVDRVGVSHQITMYGVWRKIPPGRTSVTRHLIPRGMMNDSLGVLFDFVGSLPATQSSQYNIIVPTLEDASTTAIVWSKFLVTAHTADPTVYYVSQMDSGWSQDNIPPGQPKLSAANIVSPTSARVHWDRNISDPDIGRYNVYRDTSGTFVVDPANFVGTTSDTTLTNEGLTAGLTYWYRVTSVDIHGNESTPTDAFSPIRIKANVRVFLEGPLDSLTHLMKTTLGSDGYLVAHFATVPIPSTAVDSVNIEMRDNASAGTSSMYQFRPAWLLADGTLRGFFDTTKTYVEFDAQDSSYYLVVHHRNHLAIMMATPHLLDYPVPSDPYDFTTSQTQAYTVGQNPMNRVGTSFAMVAGDANGDGLVTDSDINQVIRPVLGRAGYHNADMNLNGQVQHSDINQSTRLNLGRGTQVPSLSQSSRVLSKKEK